MDTPHETNEHSANRIALVMNHPRPWRIRHKEQHEVVDTDNVVVGSFPSRDQAEDFLHDTLDPYCVERLLQACTKLDMPEDEMARLGGMKFEDASCAAIHWLMEHDVINPAWTLKDSGAEGITSPVFVGKARE